MRLAAAQTTRAQGLRSSSKLRANTLEASKLRANTLEGCGTHTDTRDAQGTRHAKNKELHHDTRIECSATLRTRSVSVVRISHAQAVRAGVGACARRIAGSSRHRRVCTQLEDAIADDGRVSEDSGG